MLSVPVFNMQGQSLGAMEVDPAILGGEVRPALIKQAIVAFLDHQRQQNARTKGRGDVEGSTRKIYRQKGTGNARMGTIRTCIRRGGGRAFAKLIPRRSVGIPKKMRRQARNSAILAKMQTNRVMVVDGLAFGKPKTKPFAQMLKTLGADQGCVLAIGDPDSNVVRSGRNIPKTEIRLLQELNAYEIARRPKLILTKQAFERLLKDPKTLGNGSAAE